MKTNNMKDILELPGEESIILQKTSKYWNQQNRIDRPDGILLVTNYRLIFVRTHGSELTKTELLCFPLNIIEDLEVKKVMLISPAIRFKVEGNVYMFTLFSGAKEVVAEIEKFRKLSSS